MKSKKLTTEKYNRRLKKPLSIDTPAMRAAVNVVIAVENNEPPSTETIKILAKAFKQLLSGKSATEIFGKPLGFGSSKGRPEDYGFTQADVVSCFIEIHRRNQIDNGNKKNPIQTAKENAIIAFRMENEKDPMRTINRFWAEGKKTIQNLTLDDLQEIIAPYKRPDKK